MPRKDLERFSSGRWSKIDRGSQCTAKSVYRARSWRRQGKPSLPTWLSAHGRAPVDRKRDNKCNLEPQGMEFERIVPSPFIVPIARVGPPCAGQRALAGSTRPAPAVAGGEMGLRSRRIE